MPGMKTMMYIMPIMFMLILNNFSAGLTYYYFLANVITLGQNLIFKQFIDEDKILLEVTNRKGEKIKMEEAMYGDNGVIARPKKSATVAEGGNIEDFVISSVPIDKNLRGQDDSLLDMHKRNSLAIVPFNGKILNKVISVMDGLGLKRNAEEELESVAVKKR